MTAKVKFTKMHGAGNDYIYVDTMRFPIDQPDELARRWSAPHTGIGSDGLVLIGPPVAPDADFSMRIFNADGSEALMCGNASRCVGKYLYERGLTDKTVIRLQTLSGIKTLLLKVAQDGTVEQVTVDMLAPALSNGRQFLSAEASECADLPAGTFVSMGNPHYVIFTDHLDRVLTDGPRLECHPAFPERCNIEFARIDGGDRIRVRVWERGSGQTMACGSGACATAVAAMLAGHAGRRSTIVMDGGTLHVEWREDDGHILLSGPAEFVFDGEISSKL
ncbi:MAG: diaminopimelate epimerase [Prevotella sp.]|nr:diaminopimelate epimerase [Prevotella sp.]